MITPRTFALLMPNSKSALQLLLWLSLHAYSSNNIFDNASIVPMPWVHNIDFASFISSSLTGSFRRSSRIGL
jgi:hypothetical protein